MLVSSFFDNLFVINTLCLCARRRKMTEGNLIYLFVCVCVVRMENLSLISAINIGKKKKQT